MDKGNANQSIPSQVLHAIFRGFKGDIISFQSDVNRVTQGQISQTIRIFVTSAFLFRAGVSRVFCPDISVGYCTSPVARLYSVEV
jgi:hypothetical protein